MTADLVTFLRDCLDEEQREAEDALKRTTTTRRRIGGQWVEDTVQPPEWRRSAWPPARVLREIDARRRIMDCHESWVAGNGDTICGRCGREHIEGRPGGHFPCQTLRLLALPYADHPGYREEWKP
jgi:hypothetical protein